jgi:threonine dehydratase
VAEPAGAAATAAWVADSNSEAHGATVLLVTGSNIAESVLRRALGQENTISEDDEIVRP